MSKTNEQKDALGAKRNAQKDVPADGIKPLEHLEKQAAAKPKKEETGYVGGRLSMKQMKLYLAYSAPNQKHAIKSLCGALDQHKKKKAA